MNSESVQKLVEEQISAISDNDRQFALRAIVVNPYMELREWDYAENTKYQCWIIAEPKNDNYVFAFCNKGFGPNAPWGIIKKDIHGSMGPDACWYTYLDDLFIGAGRWDGSKPKNFEVR
jgi:hypothetical protein